MPPRGKSSSGDAKSPARKSAGRAGKGSSGAEGLLLGGREATDATAPAGVAPSVARPVSLDAIHGQTRAKETLRAAMASGRLAHAWIFHGPAGVGKFTSAIAFAAELLAFDEQTRKLLANGLHPDLGVINKELAVQSRETKIQKAKQVTIPKEVISEFLLERAGLMRAFNGPSHATRVFIIDEAELLDRFASHAPVQAAMLKLLEEPPEGVVIILVTTDETKLLVTVRSRCQRVAFVPLSDDELRGWLTATGVQVSPSEMAWLMAWAEGSPGRMRIALDHGMYRWHQMLDPLLNEIEAGRLSAGIGLAGQMCALIEEKATSAADADPLASKEAANRFWVRQMVAYLASRAQQRMSAAIDRRDNAALSRAIGMIEHLRQLEGHVAANVAWPMAIEYLVSQMCNVIRPTGVLT
jgi:DNA polymerase-3 subunit delta'